MTIENNTQSKLPPDKSDVGIPARHSDANSRHQGSQAVITLVRKISESATGKHSLADRIKRNNMELQFWGYETGNVLATIAGTGGFFIFFDTIQTVFGNRSYGVLSAIHQLLSRYPDAAVTVGLGVLVLIMPTLRARVFSRWSSQWLNVADFTVTIIALVILCYAIVLNTSWIAIASSCFVLASCFLRQCRNNPILLKAGGLALVCGGLGLAFYGFELALSMVTDKDRGVSIMGTLTVLTGIYVVFAGFLTYEGGIFATRDFISEGMDRADDVWLMKLAHPQDGFLARTVFMHTDEPIMQLNDSVSRPAIFWVSEYARNNQPFKTSMLARLPWRVLTGLAALFSWTPAGFAFFIANVCWAMGDLAIGSEDW